MPTTGSLDCRTGAYAGGGGERVGTGVTGNIAGDEAITGEPHPSQNLAVPPVGVPQVRQNLGPWTWAGTGICGGE